VLALTKLIFANFFNNWGQNDWCQRQVQTFGCTHIDTCDYITSVFKNNRKRLRLLTQGHQASKGNRFFTSYATGNTHKCYWLKLHEYKEIYGGNETAKRRSCQKNIDTSPNKWLETSKLQVSLDILPRIGYEP
jgi:hypothetical protein